MTKFVKITAVLALVVALAACSTGRAQQESITSGEATFTHAQTK